MILAICLFSVQHHGILSRSMLGCSLKRMCIFLNLSHIFMLLRILYRFYILIAFYIYFPISKVSQFLLRVVLMQWILKVLVFKPCSITSSNSLHISLEHFNFILGFFFQYLVDKSCNQFKKYTLVFITFKIIIVISFSYYPWQGYKFQVYFNLEAVTIHTC